MCLVLTIVTASYNSPTFVIFKTEVALFESGLGTTDASILPSAPQSSIYGGDSVSKSAIFVASATVTT